MVKIGGPCQGPGPTEGSVCGITEIPDSCKWREGKDEHRGKACCTKRQCGIYLKAITPKAAKPPPAATASAGVVSPRRHGQAIPLPPATQAAAQAVPAVPVSGFAWTSPSTWFGQQQQASEQQAAATMAGMAASSTTPIAGTPHEWWDDACKCYGCRCLIDGIERRVHDGFVYTQPEFAAIAPQSAWETAERSEAVTVPTPTARNLYEVFEIFGHVRDDPRSIGQLIEPAEDGTRERGGSALDFDFLGPTLKPLYLVDGLFGNLDWPRKERTPDMTTTESMAGTTRRLIRWVTEEALLVAIKDHGDVWSSSLLRLVTEDAWGAHAHIMSRARAHGLAGTVHCAKDDAVCQQWEVAFDKAEEAIGAKDADGTPEERQAKMDEATAASELAAALTKFMAAREAREGAAARRSSGGKKRARTS